MQSLPAKNRRKRHKIPIIYVQSRQNPANMKLPKTQKRGNAHRIEFVFQGTRYSATRDTVKECEQWAAMKLLELKAGVKSTAAGIKPAYPLQLLISKYYQDIGQHKKSKRYISEFISVFSKGFPDLYAESIHSITPQMITKWRNDRLLSVAAGTMLREMSLLSAIFTYAQKELFLIDNNPFSLVSKPRQPKPRNRRISQHEIDTVIAAFGYSRGQVPTLQKHYVAWCFLFALDTAMRRGEILSITRNNIFDDYIHLPDTKSGDHRDVPLLNSAKALLSLIKHDGEKLIPLNENAFRVAWQRYMKNSGVHDLNFHDTRHHAITELVNRRKVPIEILMKITGHKTPRVLINTYYNPSASEISRMLNESD